MTDRHKFMGDAPTRKDGDGLQAGAPSPSSFPEGLADRETASGLHRPHGAVGSTVSKPSGKPKRKAIPAHVKVSVAIWQANLGAHEYKGFRCPLCYLILDSHEPRILEHMTPHATMIALGKDPDAIDNLRFVHAECAARKTNGTKATTAGSDKHMIAKGKRFDKINRGERSRKRKGPPLKSRGFDRTFRKRMNGRVERV